MSSQAALRDAAAIQTQIYDRTQDGSYHFTLNQSVLQMLTLPTLRQLQLNPGKDCKIRHSIQTNFKATLGYMVGDIEAEPCGTCRRGMGPFAHCVTLRNEMAGACSNCYYGGEASRCTLRPGGSSRKRARMLMEEDEEDTEPRPVRRQAVAPDHRAPTPEYEYSDSDQPTIRRTFAESTAHLPPFRPNIVYGYEIGHELVEEDKRNQQQGN